MAATVAVVADTHARGALELPEVCGRLFATANLIVHAGDIATSEALDWFHGFGPPVHAVRGNVDSAELQRRLPPELEVEVESARIGVVHDAGPASGRLARLRARFPASDAVIFGHSHMPLHESADGFQIFNPGSPTQRRRAPWRSVGLLRVDGSEVRFEHVRL
jgi:putative phosphoesterase